MPSSPSSKTNIVPGTKENKTAVTNVIPTKNENAVKDEDQDDTTAFFQNRKDELSLSVEPKETQQLMKVETVGDTVDQNDGVDDVDMDEKGEKGDESEKVRLKEEDDVDTSSPNAAVKTSTESSVDVSTIGGGKGNDSNDDNDADGGVDGCEEKETIDGVWYKDDDCEITIVASSTHKAKKRRSNGAPTIVTTNTTTLESVSETKEQTPDSCADEAVLQNDTASSDTPLVTNPTNTGDTSPTPTTAPMTTAAVPTIEWLISSSVGTIVASEPSPVTIKTAEGEDRKETVTTPDKAIDSPTVVAVHPTMTQATEAVDATIVAPTTTDPEEPTSVTKSDAPKESSSPPIVSSDGTNAVDLGKTQTQTTPKQNTTTATATSNKRKVSSETLLLTIPVYKLPDVVTETVTTTTATETITKQTTNKRMATSAQLPTPTQPTTAPKTVPSPKTVPPTTNTEVTASKTTPIITSTTKIDTSNNFPTPQTVPSSNRIMNSQAQATSPKMTTITTTVTNITTTAAPSSKRKRINRSTETPPSKPPSTVPSKRSTARPSKRNRTTNTTTATNNTTTTTTKTPSPLPPPTLSQHQQPPSAQQRPTTSSSSPHIYDAMLGEISDLLAAASEAQLLGRLKMASTYQLLAHTRLIGLGKTFDRFLNGGMGTKMGTGGSGKAGVVGKETSPSSRRSLFTTDSTNDGKMNSDFGGETNDDQQGGGGTGTKKDVSVLSSPQSSPSRTPPPPQTQTQLSSQSQQQPWQKQISEAQAAALARIIPSEVNLDNTMMEHLAQAAMELHYKRTGRGNKHHQQQMQLQQQQMAQQQQQQLSQPKKETVGGGAVAAVTTESAGSVIAGSGGGGVAWTVEEKEKCREAAEKFGRDDVVNITKAVGERTEAEVRAHLRNVVGRERVDRDLGVKKENDEGQHGAVGSDKGGGGNGVISNDGGAIGGSDSREGSVGGTTNVGVDASQNKTPRRSGARTKKPPTKAMLTTTDVTFDVKKILSGMYL